MISRRGFLRLLGIGGAVAAVAPYLPTTEIKPLVKAEMRRLTTGNDDVAMLFDPIDDFWIGKFVYIDPKTGGLTGIPYDNNSLIQGMYMGRGILLRKGIVNLRNMSVTLPDYYLK
jgi:hypothetical protein